MFGPLARNSSPSHEKHWNCQMRFRQPMLNSRLATFGQLPRAETASLKSLQHRRSCRTKHRTKRTADSVALTLQILTQARQSRMVIKLKRQKNAEMTILEKP